jgi:hypothetical protein
MLYIAIITFVCFTLTWIILSVLAYTAIYASLAFSYLFIWDAKTRKEICPKGLLHAIVFDE